MLSFFRPYRYFAIVFSILSIIIIALIYNTLNVYQPLPVYQPAMVSSELVDSTIQYQRKYHTIADFKFVNQNGDTITQANYAGKIYIANFFFTTCQTICPIMTGELLKVQHALMDDDAVMLLSHTVMPDVDSVAQLKRYALEKGINDQKWNLVTGSKKAIYTLARKSYLAVKDAPFAGPFDMIHTENIILVDKKRQIRGFYDGTSSEAIDRLLKDVKILEEEYSQ